MHSRRRLNFTVNSVEAIRITIPSDKIAINDELRAKQLTDNPHPFHSGKTLRKNEKRDFARENNHRYLCRLASTGVLTVAKRRSFSLLPYIRSSSQNIHVHTHITCARVYFAQRSRRNEKNIFPAPLKREEKHSSQADLSV